MEYRCYEPEVNVVVKVEQPDSEDEQRQQFPVNENKVNLAVKVEQPDKKEKIPSLDDATRAYDILSRNLHSWLFRMAAKYQVDLNDDSNKTSPRLDSKTPIEYFEPSTVEETNQALAVVANWSSPDTIGWLNAHPTSNLFPHWPENPLIKKQCNGGNKKTNKKKKNPRKIKPTKSAIFSKFVERYRSKFPQVIDDEDPMAIQIGPYGTRIPVNIFETIQWNNYSDCTRSLLCIIFGEKILGTHTLSGKPSPAFHGRERPPKGRLNIAIVADITFCVMVLCGGDYTLIRKVITTKCADMTKKLVLKQKALKEKALEEE